MGLETALNDKYEYIRLEMDWGDLSDLNRFSQNGWKVVAIVKNVNDPYLDWVLLERKTP